jgi:uncharacterized Zn finger protein (UPF0148 family)
MSDKHQCCQEVWNGLFTGSQCQRAGLIERDGKWYCRQHDPVEVQRKKDEKSKQWQERWDREQGEETLKSMAAVSYRKHFGKKAALAAAGDQLGEALRLLEESNSRLKDLEHTEANDCGAISGQVAANNKLLDYLEKLKAEGEVP